MSQLIIWFLPFLGFDFLNVKTVMEDLTFLLVFWELLDWQ